MPKLDQRGIIAAATIGFYAPVAVLTLLLLFRYALRRDAGWLFLFIFSLGQRRFLLLFLITLTEIRSARMAEGALLVAAEMLPVKIDLFIAAYVLDPSALSLLMLSTLGFIGMV